MNVSADITGRQSLLSTRETLDRHVSDMAGTDCLFPGEVVGSSYNMIEASSSKSTKANRRPSRDSAQHNMHSRRYSSFTRKPHQLLDDSSRQRRNTSLKQLWSLMRQQVRVPSISLLEGQKWIGMMSLFVPLQL